MPLLRTVARTAVISGTATAVSNNVSRRQAGRWAEKETAQAAYAQEPAYVQQQYVQPPAPAPAAGGLTDDAIAQLKQLGDLKASGVLTDEEFAAAKAKLLGV